MRIWFLGAALLCLAPSLPAAPSVTVKGSDTLVILNQRWAERYMAAHAGAVIQVTGGGSGTGIAALIGGSTDICASSRPMKEKERKALEAKTGRPSVEIAAAKDGIAVYSNAANPLPTQRIEEMLLDLKDRYSSVIVTHNMQQAARVSSRTEQYITGRFG